jgi:hypothetical protein
MLHPSTLENAHENRNLTIINSLQIWLNPEDNFEILIFFGKNGNAAGAGNGIWDTPFRARASLFLQKSPIKRQPIKLAISVSINKPNTTCERRASPSSGQNANIALLAGFRRSIIRESIDIKK